GGEGHPLAVHRLWPGLRGLLRGGTGRALDRRRSAGGYIARVALKPRRYAGRMPDQPGPASPSGVATVEWPPLGEGEVIGEQFRIVKLLGQGGMGQIFEAEDLVLQRRVAVKVPLSRGASDVLMSEARALAALSHPNLPVVHAAGRHGERGYLVMERLVGIDLGTHIERVYELGHAIRLGEALELLIDIADALHAIHQAGIVHRDVKPDNVLLCGRRGPVLIDFGLVVP